jgi:uncharacterized membrane protein YczE
MMKKRVFRTEWAYALGMIFLAIGTALMEKADFGMSMVVAPAYIVHLKVSQTLPFFSFGMAEYTLQAVILAGMMLILRRVKRAYFFSFVTAVIYGFLLDGAMGMAALLPETGMAGRCALFVSGMLGCSMGIAMLFRTYIPPEAYELFVKEIAGKMKMDTAKFKTVYDCASCLLSIALSFAFFGWGRFEGVKAGTIVCALVNGWLIGQCAKFMEARWSFCDGLKIRKWFE